MVSGKIILTTCIIASAGTVSVDPEIQKLWYPDQALQH